VCIWNADAACISDLAFKQSIPLTSTTDSLFWTVRIIIQTLHLSSLLPKLALTKFVLPWIHKVLVLVLKNLVGFALFQNETYNKGYRFSGDPLPCGYVTLVSWMPFA